MRAVVQRVTEASVAVSGDVVGSITGPGLVVLLGVTHDDTPAIAERLAEKIWDFASWRANSPARTSAHRCW